MFSINERNFVKTLLLVQTHPRMIRKLFSQEFHGKSISKASIHNIKREKLTCKRKRGPKSKTSQQQDQFIVNFIESKEKNEEDDEEKDSIPRIEETFGRLVVDSDSSKRIVKIAKHNNPVKDEHEDPAND